MSPPPASCLRRIKTVVYLSLLIHKQGLTEQHLIELLQSDAAFELTDRQAAIGLGDVLNDAHDRHVKDAETDAETDAEAEAEASLVRCF